MEAELDLAIEKEFDNEAEIDGLLIGDFISMSSCAIISAYEQKDLFLNEGLWELDKAATLDPEILDPERVDVRGGKF